MKKLLLATTMLVAVSLPAQADIVTYVGPSFEQTTVVHVGDEVTILALVHYNYFNIPIREYSEAYGGTTLYDGQGHSYESGIHTGYWHPVFYSEPGTYTLHYDAFVSLRGVLDTCLDRPSHGGSCFGNYILAASETATLTVLPAVAAVPGPVLGTGLPGLVAAGIIMVGFARKRRAKMLSAP